MKLRKLLYPFSMLYGGITTLRNLCFDRGVLRSQTYSLPIISVGNITVGGTGKTPLSEYIIRLLTDDFKLCLLSRGYKRRTQGALLADAGSTAHTIGDEPFQVKQKFPGIDVVVAEKRVEGMALIQKYTQAQVVLMDDAYQHRYVKPGLSILVIDYNRPMWDDCVFPAGRLRETARGQARAHLIVVNKCPATLTEEQRAQWISKLSPRDDQQVFFTSIVYGSPQSLGASGKLASGTRVLALAGIARPAPFFEYVSKHYKVEDTLIYPDHHDFSSGDEEQIASSLENCGVDTLLTTEKDAVRMVHMPEEIQEKCWYVPIGLKVLFDEERQFKNKIYDYVRTNESNRRLP
ncbi:MULTISPECIES: tetraacyldisaccharide 4'-kinase [unclassified Carboxylicivirga]|uniref:tetraacyldisaccharide 4'-kinase n=1 Tax=Carboxylicivirga TaxID=1628153 RepID=UPI003D3545B0